MDDWVICGVEFKAVIDSGDTHPVEKFNAVVSNELSCFCHMVVAEDCHTSLLSYVGSIRKAPIILSRRRKRREGALMSNHGRRGPL
jgi:hypothetical protein